MGYINTFQKKKKRYIPYFHLYVLSLEDGKYYVGISRNVKKRFDAHRCGEGAEWTKLYKPLKVISDTQLAFCSYTKVKPYEDGKTIELMKKYGRHNVRGGIYCAIDQNIIDSFLGESLCKEIDAAVEARLQRKKKTEERQRKRKERINTPLNERLKGFKIIVYNISESLSKRRKKQYVTRYIAIECDKRMVRIPIHIDYANRVMYIANIHMSRYGNHIKCYFENSNNSSFGME